MPICIAGMHRSGTSMITRLLNLCGLALGDSGKLISGQAGQAGENSDGFWEHYDFYSLNERLLIALNAGWDHPNLPKGWENSETARAFIPEANALLASMDKETAGCIEWGWKDPRNSLTLPFWQNLLPNLRVVICLRDPLEVARSLQKRNNFSFAASEGLWVEYYESLLAHTTTETRIVSHYAAHFKNPSGELKRLASWANLRADEMTIEQAILGSKASLRHHITNHEDIRNNKFSNYTLELYSFLREEAGYDIDLPKEFQFQSSTQNKAGLQQTSFNPISLREELQNLREQVTTQADVIQGLASQIRDQRETWNKRVSSLADQTQKTSSAIEQTKIQLKRIPSLVSVQKQRAETTSSLMPSIEKAIALHGAYTKAYRHYDFLVAKLEENFDQTRPAWPNWIKKNKSIGNILSLIRYLKWMPQIFSWQRQLHQIQGELCGTLAHISYITGQPYSSDRPMLGLEKDFGQKTHLAVPELTALLRERLAWQNIDLS